MKIRNIAAVLFCTSFLFGCGDDSEDLEEMDDRSEEYEVMAHHYETPEGISEEDMATNDNIDAEKNMENIYAFDAKTLSGDQKSLADYSGKVLLIVNTASECGFTPQYEGLQKLYDEYSDQGFEVLGFPCNQFGGQEPGSSSEIASFCQANYGVTFPMFEKVDVNGDNEHPLFTYLKSEQSGLITDAIKWNFTKFLVDKNGKPIQRYAPQTKPSDIASDIKKLL